MSMEEFDRRLTEIERMVVDFGRFLLQKVERELEQSQKDVAIKELEPELVRRRFVLLDDMMIRIERLEERLDAAGL